MSTPTHRDIAPAGDPNVEDVVVKIHRGDDRGWMDYGRDTREVATAFASMTDAQRGVIFDHTVHLVAVDDWGYGTVIAATDPDLVGHKWADVHRVEALITQEVQAP